MSGNAQPPASLQFFKLEQIDDIELWGGSHVPEAASDVRRAKITFRVGLAAWIEEVGYISCADSQWLMQDFADYQRMRGRRPAIAV
jgi:hypothetical protein